MDFVKCGAVRLLSAVVCSVAVTTMAYAAVNSPDVVWVKADKAAFEAQGVIGDGTEENPFNTIQAGVDTVAVGGTVKIMAGTYDYDEQFDGAHTNRVTISKRVVLDGVGGIEHTHIVGKQVPGNDANGNIGCGSDAIRCIKISDNAANNTIIRNLTLRDGAASDVNAVKGYGGAVCGATGARKPIWIIDCVVSNCSAVMGGALYGISALRCKFIENRSTGYGAALKSCNAMHCLLYKNKKYDKTGVTSTRPVVAETYAVNCTLVGGVQSKTSGFGQDSKVYNCISVSTSGGRMDSVSEAVNCHTEDSTVLFVNSGNLDYRLTSGSAAIGRGDSSYLTSVFSLPEGYSANVDLAGNEFDITKSTCDIGCYQRIFDWYVDAEDGDDGNSGSVSRLPMKTLAAIMPKTLPGDTVHAAAGTYDEGVMRKSETTAKARVVVPSNVTLVADQGVENTFIVGAPDTTESADEYGLGTNAVRCVHLKENSRIKGFTVTGGYTWKNETLEGFSNNNRSGGGIYGDNVTSSIAEECIISNNWTSYSGGGVFYATAIRSYLFENHSLYNGSALYDGKLYGCVVDKNYTGFSTTTRPSACWSHRAIVNCTLGPNIYTHDGGNDGCVLTGEGSEAIFSYNIVMGAMGAYSKSYRLVGCIFKGTGGNWVSKMDGCIVNAGDSIALDENYRPIVGQSIAVDRVEAASIADATGGLLPLDKDLSGFQRMMNGKIDVGALEGDWSGAYAKLLDGFGNRIEIKAADSGIVTNEVNGTASLSLHDKEAVELVWWSEQPKARRKAVVSVSGEGTLSVTRNGEAFASFTALASPAVVSVPCEGNGDCNFKFAFSGTGSADIYGFESGKGLAIAIR